MTVPEWMPVVLPRRVTVLPTAGVPAEVMSWLPTVPGAVTVPVYCTTP